MARKLTHKSEICRDIDSSQAMISWLFVSQVLVSRAANLPLQIYGLAVLLGTDRGCGRGNVRADPLFLSRRFSWRRKEGPAMQAGVVVEDLNVDDLLCIFFGLWKIFLLQELPVKFFSPFTLCTIFSRRHTVDFRK